MTGPTLLILGEQRRRGQPPIYGVPLTRRIEVWVTESQFQDLQTVAATEHKKHSEVIRDAVDSYVGDFRERPVFKRPKPYMPE